MKKIMIAALILIMTACSTQSSTTVPDMPPTTTPDASHNSGFPPVEGPDPSTKVAAFYYPWYGNPSVDSSWIHWNEPDFSPPNDISSDYFPALGAYSSRDPQVVAQHMAWLRQAGVGVIISSWWGQGSHEDISVPLILNTAEQYGIKVAFHIEPYSGRTAESLVRDVKYLYEKYGDSPAFFRSTAYSRYSPGEQPKGMFFVWSMEVRDANGTPVSADYWQPAMDAIHALPQGTLIIANTLQGSWVNGGHFDGLYNYITLHTDQNGGFNWARNLPPDSLYVPSVIPGNSARRIGYPENTYVARNDGATFNEQWTAALGTGVEPAMVTVTSFNEWHEGSMIEPPAIGANNGKGYDYADFGTLPADGYLTLTHEWIDKYLATEWPAVYQARITITTTSDWTTVNTVKGGAWSRPEQISASKTATNASMESGDRFVLMQSLSDANAGKQVEMTWDIMLSDLQLGQDLALQIDRGNIGTTQVTIYNYNGTEPVEAGKFSWGQITTGRNSHVITIPAASLINTSP